MSAGHKIGPMTWGTPELTSFLDATSNGTAQLIIRQVVGSSPTRPTHQGAAASVALAGDWPTSSTPASAILLGLLDLLPARVSADTHRRTANELRGADLARWHADDARQAAEPSDSVDTADDWGPDRAIDNDSIVHT